MDTERCTLRHLMTDTLWRYATPRIVTEYTCWQAEGTSSATHVWFEYFGGGDYVGDDLMAQANREFVLECLGEEARELFTESTVRRSYGFTTFELPLDVELAREEWEEFLDAVEQTHSYPILSEMRLEELEIACEQDAWKDYGAYDTVRDIHRRYGDTDGMLDLALNKALIAAQDDPYGIYGQRLWQRLTENDSGYRETPGSAWVYPRPTKIWRDYGKIREVMLTPLPHETEVQNG